MNHLWIGIALCALTIQTARADMELSPLRHVITQTAPEAAFDVSNPSRRILQGRVSWIDLTATETGYAPASPGARDAFSAAPYLTVAPAQFRLEPGARVKVTVRVKDGARIPKGERRSHLLIETAAARTPIRKASENGLQVDIGLSVSAPVILRNGGAAHAKIGDTKLLRDDDGALLLATTILPGGDNSSFGGIVVAFAPHDAPGEKQVIGVRNNIAGFLDAARRKIDVPLGVASLEAGELTVQYKGAEEYEGRVFDTRNFDVAPP